MFLPAHLSRQTSLHTSDCRPPLTPASLLLPSRLDWFSFSVKKHAGLFIRYRPSLSFCSITFSQLPKFRLPPPTAFTLKPTTLHALRFLATFTNHPGRSQVPSQASTSFFNGHRYSSVSYIVNRSAGFHATLRSNLGFLRPGATSSVTRPNISTNAKIQQSVKLEVSAQRPNGGEWRRRLKRGSGGPCEN